VPATFSAILTLAACSLLECRDMLGSRCDPYRLRLPEAEGVYRPTGPRTTRSTMTIAHGLRCPRDLQFYRAAKATSKVGHRLPPLSSFVIGSKRKRTFQHYVNEPIGAPIPGQLHHRSGTRWISRVDQRGISDLKLARWLKGQTWLRRPVPTNMSPLANLVRSTARDVAKSMGHDLRRCSIMRGLAWR
jgi:hypothetical protein